MSGTGLQQSQSAERFLSLRVKTQGWLWGAGATEGKAAYRLLWPGQDYFPCRTGRSLCVNERGTGDFFLACAFAVVYISVAFFEKLPQSPRERQVGFSAARQKPVHQRSGDGGLGSLPRMVANICGEMGSQTGILGQVKSLDCFDSVLFALREGSLFLTLHQRTRFQLFSHQKLIGLPKFFCLCSFPLPWSVLKKFTPGDAEVTGSARYSCLQTRTNALM